MLEQREGEFTGRRNRELNLTGVKLIIVRAVPESHLLLPVSEEYF